MHIPDGFLSARVAAGYGLLSLSGLALAGYRVRMTRSRGHGALLGVSAAFIFAAQMVNFPVAAGTSGHLVGSTLAAALLGLPRALVVMSSVLFVQCFVFGDGGVLALGANVFNMGLVGCVVGYCCLRLSSGPSPSQTRRVASAAFAAFAATVASAASCGEELVLSGAAPFTVVLPALLLVHALIGVGEAVITAVIVASVLRFLPELLDEDPSKASGNGSLLTLVWSGLGLAMAVVVLLVPVACTSPDGLFRVAQQLGLHGKPSQAGLASLVGYGVGVPGATSVALTATLCGAAGVLLLFGLCWLLALGLVPRSQRAARRRGPLAVESSG